VSLVSRFLRSDETQLVIEPMRRRHLKGIMAIEPRVYPKPWSASVFIDEIDMAHRGQRVYVVAKIGGQLVGYAGMILGVDEAHVTNIAVDPQQHRLGIGTRLLHGLITHAIEMGGHAVSLEVRVTNWGAQRMYGRFGFHPVGIRRNYYQELHEDAVVMWTDDIRTPAYASRLASIAAAMPDRVRLT
jgi:ribosomal-protein-alanine N-acetyltransferase